MDGSPRVHGVVGEQVHGTHARMVVEGGRTVRKYPVLQRQRSGTGTGPLQHHRGARRRFGRHRVARSDALLNSTARREWFKRVIE